MLYKSFAATALIALMALSSAPTVFALHSPEHYSLFDEASYISPGNASDRAVRMVSDSTPGSGGIDYGVESGLTFADVTQLSTDYRFESDDTCMGGSPRFQINVDTGTDIKNIFAYIGPAPSYTGCPAGVWANSGDLLETGMFVDTSQLPGGTFYDPYDTALTKYGSYPVVGIQLVTDAGWAFPDEEQTVDADNTLVDTTLFTYEIPMPASKADCRNGGWMNFVDDEGNTFKNQGDCVSFVASQGKNQGSGN